MVTLWCGNTIYMQSLPHGTFQVPVNKAGLIAWVENNTCVILALVLESKNTNVDKKIVRVVT